MCAGTICSLTEFGGVDGCNWEMNDRPATAEGLGQVGKRDLSRAGLHSVGSEAWA